MGAISSKGVLPSHRIDGKMKKETYHQILICKMEKRNWVLIYIFFVFFYCYTNYVLLKIGVLKRMVWPPQSPDLNPIEQVWDFVKSRLEESNKVTKKTIWAELEKAWRQVTPEIVKKYINTMKDRCQAVILAKEWPHQILILAMFFYKLSVKPRINGILIFVN
ncbi:Uncharacterized protein APZ42_006532 [Daphnia magna]|uniref:Tc1-like transposase DDE domain-containing protein n=1 Tax=Daphnia magna TaxID=35525 RepID=A0A162D3F7_9CRUS|nr:Uncharacterized protein APZ42_006532 [Daphnia magna]